MKYQNKFPIFRDATALVMALEDAVQHFPRYHKYTLGSELRTLGYDVLTAITYAINNQSSRIAAIKKAHQFSEVLKIKIHLAKNITNVRFKVFENLAALAIAVTKQCKAWQKQLQRLHQNGLNYG